MPLGSVVDEPGFGARLEAADVGPAAAGDEGVVTDGVGVTFSADFFTQSSQPMFQSVQPFPG